jgi:hypothetical protein
MKHLLLVVLTVTSVAAAYLAFLPADCLAHEHWIDVESFYPVPGETVEVHIASGHYFPKSAHVLKDDVIDGLRVFRSGADPVLLESTAGDDVRRASLAVSKAGVHIVHLTLKRPRAKQPSFEAKAIIIVGASADNPEQYATGAGLELIPQAALSGLSQDAKLPIVLALDGEPIGGSLEIVPENGKSAFLSTSAASPAMIPIRTAGKYLVAAHAGGRGCSLVFEVRPAGRPADAKVRDQEVQPATDTRERGEPEEKQK